MTAVQVRIWLAARAPAALALLLGAAAVLAVASLWGSSRSDEVRRLAQETAALVQRLQPDAPPGPLQLAHAPLREGSWPGPSDSAVVWTGLQQRLQAWGLQVHSLRAQSQDSGGELPEQTVQLRVQGRWTDWQAFEQAMAEHAPWWLPQHTLVAATGRGPDEVQVQLQARVGWRPQGAGQALPWVWGSNWPARPVAASALPLFGPIPEAAPGAAPEGRLALPSSDPQGRADPPLARWRLLGVWQQDGQHHAVLGHGAMRLNVREGQRVGREAYRVRHVGAQAVELVPASPGEPVLHLHLKEKP